MRTPLPVTVAVVGLMLCITATVFTPPTTATEEPPMAQTNDRAVQAAEGLVTLAGTLDLTDDLTAIGTALNTVPLTGNFALRYDSVWNLRDLPDADDGIVSVSFVPDFDGEIDLSKPMNDERFAVHLFLEFKLPDKRNTAAITALMGLNRTLVEQLMLDAHDRPRRLPAPSNASASSPIIVHARFAPTLLSKHSVFGSMVELPFKH